VGGFFLALATISAFLLRHPLKLFLRHRHDLAESRRVRVSLYVSLVYGSMALGGCIAAIAVAGPMVIVPVVLLSPLVVVYLYYDSLYRARHLTAELAGPLGLAAVAPAIALAAGWHGPQAMALWVILMARAIPAILYVRARLRLERGGRVTKTPPVLSHVIAIAVVCVLVWLGLSPALVALAGLVLLVRALWGLSVYRRFTKTRHIGFLEIGFGLLYVLLTATGFWVSV
jgi:hypothetical protein